ncbi:MAG: polysulfide reductase NrfD [Myxococcaceae bacterium]|nr:polysulfide reductase NrfD [Myxococcaceae bacterium]
MARPAPSAPIPGEPLVELPLLEGRHTDAELTHSLLYPVDRRGGRAFWALVLLALAGVGYFLVSVVVTVLVGIGAWGNNIPVAWAFGIINFVWWIGIGHAGTLISAILLLLQQKWRSSINRIAETMTLFAVMMAAMFPLLHLGRPWFFYWLAPYPSTTRTWPQFRSALTWDMAAITTYFTVSFLFWYLGLLPDLASARDAARSPRKRWWYGLACLGWRGSARHWHHWRVGYLLLAGLATPLVVSVHTLVSFDFAISQLPGWHSTIFPPYFVAGAIFSGLAMVLTLLLPARRVLRLTHVVTMAHVDALCRLLLVTGSIVAYAYLHEHFIAWYSASTFERSIYHTFRTGPFAPIFWLTVFCNVLVPQLFWSRRLRRNLVVVWVAALLVNVGMWSERFVIIAVSLTRTQLPSAWAGYSPTWVDWGLLSGSISLFLLLFLVTVKVVPPVPISETKELQRQVDEAEAFLREVEATRGGGGAR